MSANLPVEKGHPDHSLLMRLSRVCLEEQCSMQELATRYCDGELLRWPDLGVKSVRVLRKYFPERKHRPLEFWL